LRSPPVINLARTVRDWVPTVATLGTLTVGVVMWMLGTIATEGDVARAIQDSLEEDARVAKAISTAVRVEKTRAEVAESELRRQVAELQAIKKEVVDLTVEVRVLVRQRRDPGGPASEPPPAPRREDDWLRDVRQLTEELRRVRERGESRTEKPAERETGQ